MPKLTIKLHQSLRIENQPFEFRTEVDEGSILQNMQKLLKMHPQIYSLCLSEIGKKPGLLYLAKKTELSSLGLLDQELKEDIEIRIVPILHGGLMVKFLAGKTNLY